MLSAIDAAQPLHAHAADTLMENRGPLILSPFVLAELDYLLGRRVGRRAQLALLGDVAGAYQLEPFTENDVGHASEIVERYADLAIGLAQGGRDDVLGVGVEGRRRPQQRPRRGLPPRPTLHRAEGP